MRVKEQANAIDIPYQTLRKQYTPTPMHWCGGTLPKAR